MTLYMRVSNDRFELPTAVAEDAETLARMCGVTRNTIYSQISHAKAEGRWCAYRKIDVEDDDGID